MANLLGPLGVLALRARIVGTGEMIGCRDCQRLTSGDCGRHGTKIVTPSVTYTASYGGEPADLHVACRAFSARQQVNLRLAHADADRFMADLDHARTENARLRAEIRNHWTAWTEQGHACQFCMASTGGSVRAADFPHADGCVVPSALWSYKEAALDKES